MLKKIRTLLHNNRGDALIFGIVIMLVVLMIFYCVLTFTKIKITTAHIQNTAEQVLDTYTTTQGRNAVESIKNGTDYTVVLDKDLYAQRFQNALDISNDFTGYEKDRIKFQISDILLNYTVDKAINSNITFRLKEPIYLFGVEVTALNDTVTVASKYNVK